MDLNYLDKEKYKDIPILKMAENMHGDLPFFVRKYKQASKSYLHRHEYMQINYIYSGRGMHIVNNHEFEIIKGDIFIIPPYIPHCINSNISDVEVYEFEFEPEFINPNFKDINNVDSFFDFAYIEPFLVSESQVKPRLNLTGKIQLEAENILSEVLMEFTRRTAGFELIVKAMLLKLLVLVGREFTKGLTESESSSVFNYHRDAIYNAVRYIDENSAKELNVESIAKMFLLSQSYFSYLFKSITSKTFTEYLIGLRISNAMELLKTTQNKVIDICYEVGFNNVNHFNRVFRQQIGIPPLAYRKTNR